MRLICKPKTHGYERRRERFSRIGQSSNSSTLYPRVTYPGPHSVSLSLATRLSRHCVRVDVGKRGCAGGSTQHGSARTKAVRKVDRAEMRVYS